jgi:ADP-dependent NAD(P)H-hydrate dehydratase / NAD(P)H-hydrate epimerase
MRPLFNRGESREFDRHAIEQLRVPGIVLMENAGRGAAEAILARFSHALELVVVVGGSGQNGGDAWVVARHLLAAEVRVVSFATVPLDGIEGDARVNLDALVAMGEEPRPLERLDEFEAVLARATLVVEGLFGTGLTRAVDGKARAVLEAIDRADAPLVSLDLPSGVDADTGQTLGYAPEAALTVTFLGEKRGLYQHPGRRLAGEIVVAELGVPVRAETSATLLEAWDLVDALPRRARDAHKGTSGHAALYAGSPDKPGASLLAGLGALRAGAGLVTIVSSPEAAPAITPRCLELMFQAVPPNDADALQASFGGKSSGALGPGLGESDAARAFIERIALGAPFPLCIDADGLNGIAHGVGLAALREAAGPRVLTPHPKEAARLLGVTTGEVQRDRFGAAARLAEMSGHVAVLKGACTVVACRDGRIAVCPRGTPALGTPGTGDVLAGITAALLAQLEDPFEAACMAVLWHALAGEWTAATDRGALASEVADALPDVLASLRAT